MDRLQSFSAAAVNGFGLGPWGRLRSLGRWLCVMFYGTNFWQSPDLLLEVYWSTVVQKDDFLDMLTWERMDGQNE